jgi:two-component system, NarL family, nitrate/nitrite response regulator NarL
LADKIRVGVVDIYPIYREGVVQAIGRAEGVTVIAQGGSAGDAARIARQCHVLLLEPAVPDSLIIAKEILARNPDTKVVFLAAVQDDEHAHSALLLGVHGYLMKEVTGTGLVEAVRGVHGGARQIVPELALRLLTRQNAVVPVRSEPLELLTVRERKVLDHTSRGLTNQQIAEALSTSISTIKRHKTSLFRLMGVRNRVEAIATTSYCTKPKRT